MTWWKLSPEDKWSEWSAPFYSGCGEFTQVRFRLADNKMEKRNLFVNGDQSEVSAAWAAYEKTKQPAPGAERKGEGENG